MPYQREFDQPMKTTMEQPPCAHLRSKAMYVTGELDPSHLDEVDSHDHNCWCNASQHTIGPDDGVVERETCIAGRTCYQIS